MTTERKRHSSAQMNSTASTKGTSIFGIDEMIAISTILITHPFGGVMSTHASTQHLCCVSYSFRRFLLLLYFNQYQCKQQTKQANGPRAVETPQWDCLHAPEHNQHTIYTSIEFVGWTQMCAVWYTFSLCVSVSRSPCLWWVCASHLKIIEIGLREK